MIGEWHNIHNSKGHKEALLSQATRPASGDLTRVGHALAGQRPACKWAVLQHKCSTSQVRFAGEDAVRPSAH